MFITIWFGIWYIAKQAIMILEFQRWNMHWIIIGAIKVQAVLNYVMHRVLIVKNSVHSPFLHPYKNAEIFWNKNCFNRNVFHVIWLHYILHKLLQSEGHKCMDHLYVTSALLSGSTHPVKSYALLELCFYCNIDFCVFTFSWSFTVPVEVVTMILNHIYGSRNQIQVTSKIYEILDTNQESNQDSAWFQITSTKIDSGGTLGSSIQDLSFCWNVLKDYWAYFIFCYFFVVISIERCFCHFYWIW